MPGRSECGSDSAASDDGSVSSADDAYLTEAVLGGSSLRQWAGADQSTQESSEASDGRSEVSEDGSEAEVDGGFIDLKQLRIGPFVAPPLESDSEEEGESHKSSDMELEPTQPTQPLAEGEAGAGEVGAGEEHSTDDEVTTRAKRRRAPAVRWLAV